MLVVEFGVKRQDNMAESWYQILIFFFVFQAIFDCLLQFQQ
jgi:hypothetical protein